MTGLATWLGLGTGTLPQWGSLVGIWGLFASIITIWIKGKPDRQRADNEGRKIDNDAHAASRRDDRADVERLTERMDRQDEEIQEAKESCRTLKVQVAQLHFALRLAIAEIEAGMPQSRVPSQIQHLLAAAFPMGDPSGLTQPEMDEILGRVR